MPDEVVRLALPQGPQESGILPWSELQEQAPLEPHKPSADQPATIIYTSGTTGVPKGVVLSFASMYLAASNFLRLFTISASDRMFSCQSFSHIGERQFVEMTSLLGGQQVFFVERAATFLEDCRRARPTLFIASPKVWQDLMDACDRHWPARWQGALLRLRCWGRARAGAC
ncbi:AMP-binding protein [Halopseudomonas pachastrellae]|nr:AMP-binding protein [Halopseudomonas pachastrellae]